MDVVWLILDSISFSETSFSSEGENTMPGLSALTEESGVCFSRAYSPGPASPSAHASMFTNRLPSVTGTHEASPSYDGHFSTIADVLNEYTSLLVSVNPFLFDGLEDGFDVVADLTGIRDGDGAPVEYELAADALEEPLISALSSVPYSSLPQGGPDSRFRNAGRVNNWIRKFLEYCDGPSFVVANYMDAHPPYVPPEETIEKFDEQRAVEELPIGVPGHELDSADLDHGDAAIGAETLLYWAAIRDLDHRLTPLVRDLLGDDTAVIVTADHGNWVGNPLSLDDRLLHVPLVIFRPDSRSKTIDETVSTLDLPSTTLDILNQENTFPGESVLGVTSNRECISESIHKTGAESPVALEDFEETVQHDIAGICGDTIVKYIDGSFEERAGEEFVRASLQATIQTLIEAGPKVAGQGGEYDEETLQRLRDLGYR